MRYIIYELVMHLSFFSKISLKRVGIVSDRIVVLKFRSTIKYSSTGSGIWDHLQNCNPFAPVRSHHEAMVGNFLFSHSLKHVLLFSQSNLAPGEFLSASILWVPEAWIRLIHSFPFAVGRGCCSCSAESGWTEFELL